MRRLAFAALLLAATVAARAAPASPVGTWRTFDDETGQENGAVQIFEQGGMLYGQVKRILDPAKAAAVCAACADDRQGKPVLGLQIIRGLKPDGDAWDGGEILDPKNGKIYKAKLQMQDGGQKLLVRGFIGISLFGRTQTWVRE